jgi:hypothetical protein
MIEIVFVMVAVRLLPLALPDHFTLGGEVVD